MNDLNNRFLEFYNFLVSERIVKNAAEFTKRLSVSTSLMTEIKNGRTSVGTKIIQSTVKEFKLNANWLFTGAGQKILTEDTEIIENNVTITKAVNSNQITYIISRYEEMISKNALLIKENSDLKKELKSNKPTNLS